MAIWSPSLQFYSALVFRGLKEDTSVTILTLKN